MKKRFDVISPVDGSKVLTMEEASPGQIARCLDAATAAARTWKQTTVAERVEVVTAFTAALGSMRDEIAESLTLCMGRPSQFAGGEVDGTIDRALYMASIAETCLSDVVPETKRGFERRIKRDPLGTVLVLSPWNYPYLTAVNAVVPALLCGNSVILKHSDQTPLAAEHFKRAFKSAGLDENVFQVLHMNHEATAQVLGDDCIDHVAFTGSVEGGAAVSLALAKRTGRKRFIGSGMELGGNDPAYIRADANIPHAAVNVIEGALFNSGQSCCGIERVYVHEAVAAEFIDAAVAEASAYVLGDPRLKQTTLGPLARRRNADAVRAQIAAAKSAGARLLIDENGFDAATPESAYVAPQLLLDVDHSMGIMASETFGPCVGIMPVKSDEEAIELMNDSEYGLTASIWTRDADAATRVGDQLETGTVFMNRCDYLDPALAWTGVKNSGRGATLSAIGFEHLTRPKSFHLRTEI